MVKTERDIKAQFNRDTGRITEGLTAVYNHASDLDIDNTDMIVDRQFYEYLINKIINNE